MKSPFTSARVKKEPVYVALVNGAEASLEAGAPGLIHGVQAGSIPEWNVAQALDILKVRYQYQVPVGSGRRLRGGRVLDFLIYRPVRWLALMVNGRYWHTGKNTDELEVQDIKRMMYDVDVEIIWEENCGTVEEALMYLRQKLYLG